MVFVLLACLTSPLNHVIQFNMIAVCGSKSVIDPLA